MRLAVSATAALVLLAASGAADAAVSVEVKDAAVRVTVIPENRQDIKVEILSANPRLPLKVRSAVGRTIIDGRLNRKLGGCTGVGEAAVVRLRGGPEVTWADLPRIVIRTPRDVNIDTGGAVWGVVGRSASLRLGAAGCGDWMVGNVEGAMTLSLAGSGDTRTGSSRSAKIRLAGSGDIAAAAVGGALQVDVAGSGDVDVASVAGPLQVHTAGSGNVRVRAGQAPTFNVSIAGSGNVDFGGEAGSLKASIAGSGDVHARAVTGSVTRSTLGSGRVTVGG
jgi:hypothetical protein